MNAPLHTLRYDEGTWRGVENVVCGRRKRASAIVDLHMLVKFAGLNIRYATALAIVYGGRISKNNPVSVLPLALTRSGDTTWRLEECCLEQGLPRTAYLLVDVPIAVGESWVLR